MADVAYQSWSLIPHDVDPLTSEPTVPQPPMMASIALDPGGSLHFVLKTAPPRLTIQLTATALSAEGRSQRLLRVLRGTEGSYERQDATWERGQDGPNAIFTTTVGGTGDRVKLHLPEGLALVATGIAFREDA
jgi:hypothetical protein